MSQYFAWKQAFLFEKIAKLNYAGYMETSQSCLKNEGKWNQFIIENSGLFLQSWEWGKFQESLGREIWRLGDGENWAALVIKYDLPLGKNYLYCPGGPVINSKVKIQKAKLQVKIQKFLDDVKDIAEQEKSIFLKIEPFWEDGNEILKRVQDDIGNRFQKSDGGQRVLKTLVLDLDKSEEELLAGMKQKARYNIRLAEKHGIKIRISNNTKEDFESFWRLTQETIERDKFFVHSKEHYKKLLTTCHPERSEGSQKTDDEISRFTRNDKFNVKLFLAEHYDKIIAANIVVFFGKKAIYLHGASANEHRNLMAPYLLQWEQIKEAKKLGCAIYDFWGIDEQKWPGVTRFKKGFGGEEIDYIGAHDYVFDKMWYWIYKFAKRIL